MRFPLAGKIILCVLTMLVSGKLLSHSRAEDPATREASFSNTPLKIQYNIAYGLDSEPMHRADIYRPKNIPEGRKLPGIILIHGGAWTAGDKLHDTQHAKAIANFGAVVVVINYRLSPRHPFPAQIDDCRLAYRWMIEHAEELQINTDALGAWGYSAGGHLAALLATDPSEGLPRLKVCVSGAAPCDLTRIPANSRVLSSLFGGTRAQFPERYKQASPVTYVSSDDPPIFLFHGSKDWLVSPEASLIMKESLDNHHVINEHMVVPDKGHLMTFVDKQALALSYAFLRRHLAPLDISIAEIQSDAENQCTVHVRSKAFKLPADTSRFEKEISDIHPTSINLTLQSDTSNKERVLKQILGIINPLGIELYEGNQRLLGGMDPQ